MSVVWEGAGRKGGESAGGGRKGRESAGTTVRGKGAGKCRENGHKNKGATAQATKQNHIVTTETEAGVNGRAVKHDRQVMPVGAPK